MLTDMLCAQYENWSL